MGFLYVIPVIWFGVWSSPYAMVPAAVISAVSTLLAVAGFAVNIVEDSAGGNAMNRVLAIVALWLSLLAILMRKAAEQERLQKSRP